MGGLKTLLPAKAPLSDIEQARRLIAAIDRGGIPLNPARVKAVARNLGAGVSKKGPGGGRPRVPAGQTPILPFPVRG